MSWNNRRGEYDNLGYNEVNLLEFEFINNQEKIIDVEKIEEVKKELLFNDKKAIIISSEALLKDKKVIQFSRRIIKKNVGGKKIEKDSIIVSVIELQGNWDKGFNANHFLKNVLPKMKYVYEHRILMGFEYDKHLFNFNLWNIEYREKAGRGYNYSDKTILTFDTLNDLFMFIVKEIHDKESFENIMNFTDIESAKSSFKEKFGIEFKDFEIPKYVSSDESYSVLTHILAVTEKRIEDKQYRFFLYVDDVATNKNYKISFVSENNSNFNYIDENRFGIFNTYGGSNKYFIDMDIIKKNAQNEYEINFKAFRDIHNNINHLLSNEQRVITKSLYDFYSKRDNIIRRSENRGSVIEQKIYDKYIEKLENNEEVLINGVSLTLTSIEIKEQNVKIEFDTKTFNIIKHFPSIKSNIENINETDFGEFLLKMLGLSNFRDFNDYDENGVATPVEKREIKINGIPIVFTKKEDRCYINEIFVRQDDLSQMIVKAVCYYDKEDYEHYLSDVSHIGMDWKTMLSNGVNLTIQRKLDLTQRNKGSTSFLLRFSFSWDTKARSKIYLVVDNEKYQIKYKPNFLRYFGTFNQRTLSITELVGCLIESVEGITNENVMGLVNSAVKEAKIVKERGEELVRETIRDTKASIGKLNEVEGYYLTGIKGNKYFIGKDDLNVYKFANGQFQRRCVVDVANKHRIYEDKVANRLVNIYNENPRIHTIQN
jgi:hypothetical protein